MTMHEIEELARKYSVQREVLVRAMTAFRRQQSALERAHFRRLRRLAVRTKEAEAAVKQAVEQSPQLFAKPRSVILHGIKLGYRKGAGKIEWEDDSQVVKLIRKRHPDMFDVFVKVVEKPLKGPLQQLSVAQLKALAITVEDTGDVAFVAPIDSEVNKALKALMRELPEEIEEAAG